MASVNKKGNFLLLPSAIILLYIFLIPLNLQSNNFSNNKQIPLPQEITPAITLISDYLVISETPIPTATPKPTRTPTPKPTVITSVNLEEFFTKYANLQSVDRELLKRIAFCESKFNPNSINGPYGGMFQFTENAWINARRSMNLDTNPNLRFNAEESIKTAAYKLSTGGINSWPNCSR